MKHRSEKHGQAVQYQNTATNVQNVCLSRECMPSA